MLKRKNKYMIEQKRITLLVAILLLGCSLSNTPILAEESRWSMEFRIAADPDKDKLVVDKAREDRNSKVYEDKSLIAKWVPAVESKTSDFLVNQSLVTRQDAHGGVELLVLITEDDITDRDVSELGTTLDRYGKLALEVCFKDTRPPKYLKLTKNNINRHLAQIVDGQVHSAPQIVSAADVAMIAGNFTEDQIDKMIKDSPFKRFYSSPPPGAITITPLRILIFLIVLFLLVFGSLPARGLRESSYPRSWIIVGIVIGIVIGGYWVGVTKSTPGPDNPYGIPPWGDLIQISILGVLFGSVVGGLLGVPLGYLLRFIIRRVVHNASGIIYRILPSKTENKV